MIFVGANKEEKDATINRIIMMIIGSVIAVVVVCKFITVMISMSITKSLKEGIGAVQTVASGQLYYRQYFKAG